MYTPNLDFLKKTEQAQNAILKQVSNINYLNDLYKLYKTTDDDNNIRVNYINNQLLENFCNAFDKLYNISISKEDRLDDSLYRVLSYIRNYRFEVTKTPLPFNHDCLLNEPFSDHMQRVERIKHSFPNYFEIISSVSNEMETLISYDHNPLFDGLIEFFKEGILYFDNARNFTYVKEFVETNSINKIEVISGKDFRSKRIAEKLCILGYPSWVNDTHIFLAPKFQTLEIIVFNFTGYRYRNAPQLKKTMGKMNIFPIPEIERGKHTQQFIIDVNPDEEVTRMNLEYFRKYSSNQEKGDSKNTLKCRLTILFGNKFAFLTNEPGIDETQRVLEIDEKGKRKIKSKKVSEMTKGDIILLRVGSSEDLVIEIANKLLGTRSSEIKESQLKWKNKLKGYKETNSQEKTIKELQAAGIKLKDYKGALKRWIEDSNIMLDTPEDFKKLLQVIQFGKIQAELICNDMIELDSARHRAGKNISRKLLKLISETDLEELEQQGWQEFELEDTGARIGLFAIQEISEEDTMMPSGKLDRPLDQRDIDG